MNKLGNLQPTSLCDEPRFYGGWISSCIIVSYGYVSGEGICQSLRVVSRQSSVEHSVCSEFSLYSSYIIFLFAARRSAVSLVRRDLV